MKSLWLTILIIICSAISVSQIPNVYLNSVSFSDSLHGCIAGNAGVILWTTDGGVGWNLSLSGVPATDLWAVQVVDRNNGWAVGDGFVLRTRDGGKNWASLPTNSVYREVFFVDTSTGFIAGDGCGIQKTTDGGQTWHPKNGRSESTILLLSLGFIDASHGWAAGGSYRTFMGALLWTSNAGESWTVVDTNMNEYIRDAQFISDKVGFIGFSGIHKTTDRGIMWTQKDPSSVYGLQFVDTATGWAVGGGGTILKSINGGDTWAPQTSNASDDLFSVHFVDRRRGWAVGGWHSTILGTTDGGLHWVQQYAVPNGLKSDPGGIPLLERLDQNYPNPFNPSTTIRYALPHRSHVLLIVFNTLGQVVATLVNEGQDAGYHDVRFEGSAIAGGVYFYRLQAGDFVQSRKLVLLK